MNFEEFKLRHLKVPVEEFSNTVIDTVPNPSVTVILITYQHKDYIRDSIENILMQNSTFDFEILIGDDESIDGTREICYEFAKKYPKRIRLFLHSRDNNLKILGKPCGIFQYTYLLYQARGKYIAVCSGDDFWTDVNKLQIQHDFLNNNPNYSLAFHPWIEKRKNSNSCFQDGPLNNNFPKASTMMHLNINNYLPYEFPQVIQEDVFTWFILETIGLSKCLNEIKPTVCWTLSESISNSLNEEDKNMHVIHAQEKIIQAYHDTKSEYKAKLILLSNLKNKLIRQLKSKNLNIKSLQQIVKLFLKYNLFIVLIRRIYLKK